MSRHAHPGSAVRWRVRATLAPRDWTHSTLLACGLAFAGTLAVAMLQHATPFYYDSGDYWSLGSTFTVHGHFSLLNFNSSGRGYLLPLIDHFLQTFANDLTWTSSSMAKLFNAVVFALIGTVLGPALIKTVWPQQPSWGLGRRLVLTTMFIVFWSGHLNTPLSDFPGLAIALLALVAVARTDSPGWMLLAGFALGMSIDTRAAYIPFAPAVFGLVAWAWLDQRGTRHASAAHRALCLGLLILGFVTASLPQSLAAHRHYGTWSFVPSTSNYKPAVEWSAAIALQGVQTQIVNGVGIEWIYGYPAGQRLVEELNEGRVTSTGQYFGLFVSHPLVMGGLMIGHIVNNLDPLYPTAYVEKLKTTGGVWRRVTSFLILFAALLRLLWPAARHRLGPGRLRYFVALATCVLTTLPTKMESRYLLPLFLIIYTVALTPGWPKPIASTQVGLHRLRAPAILATAFVAYASAVWYITEEAISHFRVG